MREDDDAALLRQRLALGRRRFVPTPPSNALVAPRSLRPSGIPATARWAPSRAKRYPHSGIAGVIRPGRLLQEEGP